MKKLNIKRHYENDVFKGRSFYKDGVYYTITFGRNSSYDLYYSAIHHKEGSGVSTESNQKVSAEKNVQQSPSNLPAASVSSISTKEEISELNHPFFSSNQELHNKEEAKWRNFAACFKAIDGKTENNSLYVHEPSECLAHVECISSLLPIQLHDRNESSPMGEKRHGIDGHSPCYAVDDLPVATAQETFLNLTIPSELESEFKVIIVNDELKVEQRSTPSSDESDSWSTMTLR